MKSRTSLILSLLFSIIAYHSTAQISGSQNDLAPANYQLKDTVVAIQLLAEAKAFRLNGNSKEGYVSAQKARDILMAIFQEPNVLTAEACNAMGIANLNMGDYLSAANDFQQAINTINGQDKYDTQKTIYLKNIAIAYSKIGMFESAFFALDTAVFLLETSTINNPNIALDVYVTYGNVHLLKGQNKEAIIYYQKVMQMSEPFSVRKQKAMMNIVNAYMNLEEFETALQLLDDLLAYKATAAFENEGILPGIYSNKSIIYNTLGEYQNAIEYAEKALNIYLKLPVQYEPQVINAYVNAGNPQVGKGNFSRGIEYFLSSLALAKKYLGENGLFVYKIYNNIASTYYKVGDYDLSLEYYKKGERILLNSPGEYSQTDLAFLYNNIGGVYVGKSNSDSAFYYLETALALNLQYSGQQTLTTASSYIVLGSAFLLVENYEKAKEHVIKSLEIRKEILGSKNPFVSQSYLMLGNIALHSGQFKEALQYSNQALQALEYYNSEDVGNINSIFSIVEILSFQLNAHTSEYKKTGELKLLETAYTFGKDIIKVLDYQMKNFTADQTIFNAHNHHQIYEDLIFINYALQKITGNDDFLEEAFFISERAKASLLIMTLKGSEALHFSNISASVIHQENALHQKIASQINKRKNALDNGISRKDSTILIISNSIFELTTKRDQLLQELNSKYPAYYKAKYELGTVSTDYVQNNLLNNEHSLLQFFTGDSTIYLFLIQQNNYEVHQIKHDFPLEQWVKNLTQDGIYGYYGKSLENRKDNLQHTSNSNYTLAAQQLYNKLIAPVKDKLTEQLIIIPDGVLGYVPFEVLLKEPPRKEGRFASYPFLVYDHQISYCYSATLLREMKEKQHQKNPEKALLAMAPFFQDDIPTLVSRIDTVSLFTNRDSISPLPATGEEVASIGKLWDGKTYYRQEASIQQFAAQADQYRMIHLSTHGKADDRVGDYAYLAFGTPSASDNFEKLYARDLYNYSLNADMVVLSACETGLGKLQKGEGIISLARAFAYAGAKSIFTTLWQVNDEKTKELMISFYKNLKKGKPKDAALRKAKLDYLDQNDGEFMHPFFWAGMIGIGDMSKVKD